MSYLIDDVFLSLSSLSTKAHCSPSIPSCADTRIRHIYLHNIEFLSSTIIPLSANAIYPINLITHIL